MTTASLPSAPSRRLPPWMLVLGLFMAAVGAINGYFVWLSTHGHRDLVRDDYYALGLKQDSLIALAAAAGPAFLRREGGDLVLEAAAGGAPATGCRLRFYRPDDGRADREVRLERAPSATDREVWKARSPELRRGRWIVTAVWDRQGMDVREASLELAER